MSILDEDVTEEVLSLEERRELSEMVQFIPKRDAEARCEKVLRLAAEGKLDLGSPRARVWAFAEEGLQLTPMYLDPDTGRMHVGVRFRDEDRVTHKFRTFEVPKLSLGVCFLDPIDFTYHYSCAKTPEELERLESEARRLMSEMDREALERFTFRMVGLANRMTLKIPIARSHSVHHVVEELPDGNVREQGVGGPEYLEVGDKCYVEGQRPDEKWILMHTCHMSAEQADERLAQLAADRAVEDEPVPKPIPEK